MDCQELFPWACEVLWATVPADGGQRLPVEVTARKVLCDVRLTLAEYDWIVRHAQVMARDADALNTSEGLVN